MAGVCCVLENDKKFVLEGVTILIAIIFLLPQIFMIAYNTTYMICCSIGVIIASSFGIASLQNDRSYRLGCMTVFLGVVVFMAFAFFLILSFYASTLFVDYINMLDHDIKNRFDPPPFSKGFVTFILVFMFAFSAFGLVTMLALVIKHRKVCKQRRQQRQYHANNANIIMASPIDRYMPMSSKRESAPSMSAPSQQQPTSASYYGDLGQPQQQQMALTFSSRMPPPQGPPPDCEKGNSDMN